MFVRSRPNSPPRLDRFTILSSASYARASLAHAVDDLKPIEFFSLSPTIFYTFYFVRFPLLTILYNRRNFFIRSRFLTPTRPFIYQHPSTRRGISKGVANATSLNAIQFGTFTTEFYSARDNIALCICGAMRTAIRRPHFFVPFPRMHVRAHVFARRLPTVVSFAPRGL